MAVEHRDLINGYTLQYRAPSPIRDPEDWHNVIWRERIAGYYVVAGYYTRRDGTPIHAFRVTTSGSFTGIGGSELNPVIFPTEQEARNFLHTHQPNAPEYPTQGEHGNFGWRVIPVQGLRALENRSDCIKVRVFTDNTFPNTFEVWAQVNPTDRQIADCPEYLDPNAPGPEPQEQPRPNNYRGFRFN